MKKEEKVFYLQTPKILKTAGTIRMFLYQMNAKTYHYQTAEFNVTVANIFFLNYYIMCI